MHLVSAFHYRTFNSRITSFTLRHHQPVHTAYQTICIDTTRIFHSATGCQLGQQPCQLNSAIHPASPFRFMNLSGVAFLFVVLFSTVPLQRFIWFWGLVCFFLLPLICDITKLYMIIGPRCCALLLSWAVFSCLSRFRVVRLIHEELIYHHSFTRIYPD